jgi:hypothetical protein
MTMSEKKQNGYTEPAIGTVNSNQLLK